MGRQEDIKKGNIIGYVFGGICAITTAATIIGVSRISKGSDSNHSSPNLDGSQQNTSKPKSNKLPANVVKFNEKYGFDIGKTKKCFKYYNRKIKKDALTLSYTYDYIDSCYKDKRCNADMSDTEKLTVTNQLLNRFDDLNKKHKFSYSIVSSVAISFIISLLFVFLQIPTDENGLTFFEQFYIFVKGQFDFIINCDQVIVSIILFPVFLFFFCIALFVPFSIVIITLAISDILYYSTYRNFVVPYERKVIIQTLQTFDKRYEDLD